MAKTEKELKKEVLERITSENVITEMDIVVIGDYLALRAKREKEKKEDGKS